MNEIAVDLQEVSQVKRRLSIEVPAAVAQQEYERVASQFRSSIALPGFRRGKAPAGLVKRHYRREIRGEFIQQVVPRQYEEAIRERDLQPVGQPDIRDLTYEEGEPLRFVASFEVLPTVKLPDLDGIEVEVDTASVGDEEVEEQLEAFRERYAVLEPVEDRGIENGDIAFIDLLGYEVGEDGPADEPTMEQENVQVRVGDEKTHPDFTRALLGLNIAEGESFQVDYPQDYPDDKLAGRTIRFEIEVTDVKRKKLPALDDELAREAGDFETLDDLRLQVGKDMAVAKQQNRERELRGKAIEKLVAATHFEVPDILVERRIDERIRDLAYEMTAKGVDLASAGLDWQRVREDLRPVAERDVRADLVLSEFARTEKIEPDPEEVEQEMARIAEATGETTERLREQLASSGRMEEVRRQLGRRKTLDWILERIGAGS